MFERFTEEARNVVIDSQQEARTLRHDHVGTEHLLLGVLGLPREAPLAGVLTELGLTIEGVRERLLSLEPPREDPSPAQIPFTPDGKRVLEGALRVALARGDRHIGAEHLLLSLTRRSEDDTAIRLLAEKGITPAEVRAAVEAALPMPEPERGSVIPRSVIGRIKRRGLPAPTPIAVEFSPAAERLMMSAAARALDDGRALVEIGDIEEALRRRAETGDQPPQSATG